MDKKPNQMKSKSRELSNASSEKIPPPWEKGRRLNIDGPEVAEEAKIYYSTKIEEFRQRFLFIIEAAAADKYRYEWLENHSGISASRWQHVFLEKQLPTIDMILLALSLRPTYTNWLMHGTAIIHEDCPIPYIQSAPSEELFKTFIEHREWIKQRRKSKNEAKAKRIAATSK